ncbi:MAG TPA: EamA family transporter [Terriglobales bacterium]|nr:EamA family transporter [Terriglobales bacterium]
MTPQHRLHFKTYVLIVLMVVFGPLGNLLLGKGMKEVGAMAALAPADLFRFVAQAMSTKLIWMGIGSLIAFFVAYTLVLSWADFSYVQPTSAIAYGTSALLGHWVLQEKVSLLQWAGILTICMGVLIVGRTAPSTTDQNVKHV